MPNKLNLWNGIYPAILTPLTKDLVLDTDAFTTLAEKLAAQGVAGLYMGGNTGECFSVDDRVRTDMFRASAELKGRCKLIAHVGSVPTRRAVAMTRQAADAGMDAISAIAPYGGRYTMDELLGYYRNLADASDCPVLAYHLPARSGMDLDLNCFHQLLEIPNVIGVKFTFYDCYLLERLCTYYPEKLFYMGSDEMLIQGLAAGAAGGIGSTYNLTAPIAVELFKRFESGDITGAQSCQKKLNDFLEAFFAIKGERLTGFKRLASEVHGFQAVSPPPAIMPDKEKISGLRKIYEQLIT